MTKLFLILAVCLFRGITANAAPTLNDPDLQVTEIVSGLSAGDEVVIATVSSTIPSSGNNGGGLFGNGGRGRGNGTVQGPPIGGG